MSTLDQTTPDLDQTVNDWQTSIDWEKRFKDTQAELTRVKQQLNSGSSNNEVATAEERAAYIKQTAQEEALKVKQSLVSEQQLDFLIDNNPSLRPYEKAIKEIANAKWVAYEDVIEEYGFWSLDKLQKAKERSLVWDRWLQEAPQRSINDLSSKEREERKATNIKRDTLKDSWSI